MYGSPYVRRATATAPKRDLKLEALGVSRSKIVGRIEAAVSHDRIPDR